MTNPVDKFTNEYEKNSHIPQETPHTCLLYTSVDAFYTGYLGSVEQTELVRRLIHRLKNEKSFVFVDPAMADNGKLYAGFDQHFVQGMAAL